MITVFEFKILENQKMNKRMMIHIELLGLFNVSDSCSCAFVMICCNLALRPWGYDDWIGLFASLAYLRQ